MSLTDKYAELYKPCERCEQRIVNELTVGSTWKPIFRIKIGMIRPQAGAPASFAYIFLNSSIEPSVLHSPAP